MFFFKYLILACAPLISQNSNGAIHECNRNYDWTSKISARRFVWCRCQWKSSNITHHFIRYLLSMLARTISKGQPTHKLAVYEFQFMHLALRNSLFVLVGRKKSEVNNWVWHSHKKKKKSKTNLIKKFLSQSEDNTFKKWSVFWKENN